MKGCLSIHAVYNTPVKDIWTIGRHSVILTDAAIHAMVYAFLKVMSLPVTTHWAHLGLTISSFKLITARHLGWQSWVSYLLLPDAHIGWQFWVAWSPICPFPRSRWCYLQWRLLFFRDICSQFFGGCGIPCYACCMGFSSMFNHSVRLSLVRCPTNWSSFSRLIFLFL